MYSICHSGRPQWAELWKLSLIHIFSADGDIGNNDTVQTQNVSDTGTDSDFDAGANQNATTDPAQTDTAQATAIIENDKIEPIIAYTQKTDGNVTAIDDSVGKSENPKVYYGRTIDQYPY